MQLHFNKPISSTDQTFVLNSFISIFSQYVLMLLNSIPIRESLRAWSMSVTPAFAILSILMVPFRAFCHLLYLLMSWQDAFCQNGNTRKSQLLDVVCYQ